MFFMNMNNMTEEALLGCPEDFSTTKMFIKICMLMCHISAKKLGRICRDIVWVWWVIKTDNSAYPAWLWPELSWDVAISKKYSRDCGWPRRP